MQTLELLSFSRGGIHPGARKEATAGKPIEPLPTPHEVRLPLLQHLGEPATPIVKKNDMVRRGQKIAEGGATGVPIHATISGKVRPIEKYPHPTQVIAPAIVIQRQPEDPGELEFPEDPEWRACSAEDAIARIREAGIVGLGGAAFPTWRKLMPPRGAEPETLIINGAECEPYLTSDYRLMLAYPREIVEGALAMARILRVARVLIGVESDKRDAADALTAACAGLDLGGIAVAVRLCQVRYPQGAERQLVQALTGRVIPARALPTAVGVLVQNVATAVAVHEAVRFRRPLLDRVLTVTGPGIKEPRNLRVPLGTLIGEVVAYCGGMSADATRVVAGGPMMGRALPRVDVPVIKGMNGLVMLTGRGTQEAGFGPCISCGRCLEACPLGLEPDQVSLRVEAGRPVDTEPYGALDCYECGCCSFVCPAERPLVQFMQVAKAALRRSAAVKATA
jgi:H+/Na+-translocating ferredoxin:NAD+ oxidoreductase subunit C